MTIGAIVLTLIGIFVAALLVSSIGEDKDLKRDQDVREAMGDDPEKKLKDKIDSL